MSDICSAIHDDIKEYVRLCAKYNENVVWSHGSEDCYGSHAKLLKEREKQEEVSQIERVYCVSCGKEIMTESGHICKACWLGV